MQKKVIIKKEKVNHPSWYNQHPASIECIDVIEWMPFNVGNAIKYMWRAGLKDEDAELEDMQKAAWYVNREVERLTKLHNENIVRKSEEKG